MCIFGDGPGGSRKKRFRANLQCHTIRSNYIYNISFSDFPTFFQNYHYFFSTVFVVFFFVKVLIKPFLQLCWKGLPADVEDLALP